MQISAHTHTHTSTQLLGFKDSLKPIQGRQVGHGWFEDVRHMIYILKITQTVSHDLNLQRTVPSSFVSCKKISLENALWADFIVKDNICFYEHSTESPLDSFFKPVYSHYPWCWKLMNVGIFVQSILQQIMVLSHSNG